MSKKIVLTGGGTAGHVTPNLALLPYLKQEGYEVIYIGSQNGIERTLIEAEGIPYYGISTGKLRRYLSKECPRPYSGGVRKITLYAKMKKQSPLHISLDGFTKKQRQKIVAEIEKRRDYYAPIIEKERQEKIKAKLQEQKNREKQ